MDYLIFSWSLIFIRFFPKYPCLKWIFRGVYFSFQASYFIFLTNKGTVCSRNHVLLDFAVCLGSFRAIQFAMSILHWKNKHFQKKKNWQQIHKSASGSSLLLILNCFSQALRFFPSHHSLFSPYQYLATPANLHLASPTLLFGKFLRKSDHTALIPHVVGFYTFLTYF